MADYTIGELAKKIGKSIKTLREWDKKGVLVARRTPTNRRVYSHDQYLKIMGQEKYICTGEDIDSVRDKVVLVTGSGTLATCALTFLLPVCKKVIIYSRDEHKHNKLREKFGYAENIRYIIGDVKDKNKLLSALRNVDICVHTAAYKMIQTGLYSADEVIKVNVVGSMNVAEACIERDVKKALFISSDKACNPMNGLTYGLSKALAESAWLSYNNHSTRDSTVLFATRYGNVINSKSSFYDILEAQKSSGEIQVTDPDMTRFYFTIEEAMLLNLYAIANSLGGEIFIPKLRSASVMTFINAFAKDYPIRRIGMRGTEKLAEEMISFFEMQYTYACKSNSGREYFKIVPEYIRQKNSGWDANRPQEKAIVPFKYTSDSTDVEKLTEEDLIKMVNYNKVTL